MSDRVRIPPTRFRSPETSWNVAGLSCSDFAPGSAPTAIARARWTALPA